jgi:hypothetical protein
MEASVLCSEATIVNQGVDAARAVSLRCRAWGCPLCQPDRQRQLVALAKSGRPTTFITLTTNPAVGSSPASRAKTLAGAWRQVVKRACKKYRYKKIAYLCVFEATKKGEPHLHILARVKWIDQRWLSAQMRELIGAPIVDIRMVKSAGEIASYISKYIGKEPHRFKTCKRYWCTRSWDLSDFKREPDTGYWSNVWEVRKVSIHWLRECWEGMGWEVVQEGGFLFGRAVGSPCGRAKAI